MKLLLDGCTFLWLNLDAPQLTPAVRTAFLDSGNKLFLSVVSSWEIAVKHAAGRLALPQSPDIFIPRYREANGIEVLPLDEESVLHAGKLPAIHGDPFDRMLVCQAVIHGMAIATPDEQIRKYAVRTIW